MRFSKEFGVLLTTLLEQTVAYGNTLDDCLAIASMFDNTCSDVSRSVSLEAHAGETMSCSGLQRCPDTSDRSQKEYTEDEPCEYKRKLCVSCQSSGDGVFIRLQTNRMPSHCIAA